MYEVCEVVVTGPDADWLAGLAQNLLTNRLIACAHIVDVRSIHRSGGQIHDRPQASAAMHTRRSRVAAIVDHVEEAYPDDTPSVIVTPITDGNPAYLQWVRNRTKIQK